MKSVVNVKWNENMCFDADINGHHIILDASTEAGGENKGTSPKPLMLVALAGCTGMDVVSILKKMRIELEYFNVHVEAVAREEHPKKYTHMKVVYEFKGQHLEPEKLQNAVNLSVDKYCGVLAVYKEVIKLEFEIKILEH
jgi:putative redox protein